MGDYRIESYKKAVNNIITRRSNEIKKLDQQLEAIAEELEELEAIEEPTDADKKKMEELRKKRTELRKKVESCLLSMKTELMLVEVQAGAPQKELLPLPKWLKEIIESKGIPLGGGVSIAPDIKVDIKALKVDKFGITITIKW